MIAAKKRALQAPAGAVRRAIALDAELCAEEDGGGAYTFGFDRAGGVLRRGVGAQPLFGEKQLPEDDLPAALFFGGTAALCGESGALYVRGADGFSDSGMRFARVPNAVAVPEGGMLLWDGSTAAFVNEGEAQDAELGGFTAAAYSYDRLWLGQGMNLRFSAPASADFTGGRGAGGSFEAPDGAGDIAALCPLGSDLYVFRARGIERLTARGDEEAFSLHSVCACPAVYGDTVAAAGEGILFLTERGLYRFGGSAASPFAEEFAPCFAGVAQSDARGCVADGLYFLQARARIGGAEEPVLAVFRTDGSGGYILRRAVTGLNAYGGSAHCVCDGKPCRIVPSGMFAGRYGRAVWSCGVDAPEGRGILRSVCVRADGVFSLTVRSERGTRYLRVLPGVRSLPVSLPGEHFVLRLEGEDAGTVYSVSARFAAKGGLA